MADEQHSPPGVFGIETGFRKLTEHIDRQHRKIHEALDCLERKVNAIPTREEFDQAKQALMTAITDATTRVTTDIQALRDQIAAGNPVTDQDLADLQGDIAAVGNIDPANPVPPTGRR